MKTPDTNTGSIRLVPVILLVLLFFTHCGTKEDHVEVLVVGGGASGTTAGIQSARMGIKTLIVEETTWLGGMLTAAGVSAVDGNKNLPGGLWGEFRDKLIKHYGSADSLKTGWVSSVLFEPSVGNRIFCEMAKQEKILDVWFESSVLSIEKKGKEWIVIFDTGQGVRFVRADILIDATELGDIAKLCGVPYNIGMESREATQESIAPEEANSIIQDLTYVAILKDYGEDMTIARPEGYDSTLFACACKNPLCIQPKEPDRLWDCHSMITYGKLPNNKYMINWPLEGNDYYLNIIEMNKEERADALKKAKHHTLCFLYFIQKELGMNTLALADDEFPTDDRLPFIPYHRESRRIHGEVRFTLNHISQPYQQPEKLYRTCIAVGDYPVDHHHARYTGDIALPNLYFHPVPSFGLPLGTLIPKDIDGLIVAEKSISVSNLVNGTTRLQPVVMQIGQAAGALAALAVKGNKNIREIPVRAVQQVILESRGYLLPYLDVAIDHPAFQAYQRIGSTGILQSVGKNKGWTNQTWLRTDTVLLSEELSGLKEVYPWIDWSWGAGKPVLTGEALEILHTIAKKELNDTQTDLIQQAEALYKRYKFRAFNPQDTLLRGEFAVLVDGIIDPFNKKAIDINGHFK